MARGAGAATAGSGWGRPPVPGGPGDGFGVRCGRRQRGRGGLRLRGLDGRGGSGLLDVQRGRPVPDLLDEFRQDGPRTHLLEGEVLLLSHEVAHGVDPLHAAPYLAGEGIGNAVRFVRIAAGVRIGDDRNARRFQFELREECREFLGGRSHEFRVERAAYPKPGVEGAVGFEEGPRHIDFVARPGEHELFRGVVIRDGESGEFRAAQGLLDLRLVAADDGGHAAALGPCGQLGPVPDEPQPGLEVEDAGGEQRDVLAEAVPDDVRRRLGVLLEALEVGQHPDRVERGLGELRQAELLVGVLDAQPLDGVAEHRVGRGGVVGELLEEPLAHALDLRALPGEAVDLHALAFRLGAPRPACGDLLTHGGQQRRVPAEGAEQGQGDRRRAGCEIVADEVVQRAGGAQVQVAVGALVLQAGDRALELDGFAGDPPEVRRAQFRQRPAGGAGDQRERRPADAHVLHGGRAGGVGGVHQPGVEALFDRHPLVRDAVGAQPGLGAEQGRFCAGDDEVLVVVAGGQVGVVAQLGQGVVEGERAQDGEHPAARAVVQGAGLADEHPQAVLLGQRPGEHAGDELAQARAEQQVRLDALGHQHLGQGEFDHDDGRVGDGRVQERLGLGAVVVVEGVEHRGAQFVADHLVHPPHGRGEDRLALVEVAAHLVVLRALSGKHEDGADPVGHGETSWVSGCGPVAPAGGAGRSATVRRKRHQWRAPTTGTTTSPVLQVRPRPPPARIAR
ncbi:hypothetical protein SALB_06410 [Streptomyces noursei]|uniref:Uncharacterized protein n=1 Tax=Streptomyces noursei TaxID=1971 RepID=A0A401R7M1_STRNR|nr:hypothetical protein SALB_06410 [Streptomyces noursei]